MRVFGENDQPVPLQPLREHLKARSPKTELRLETGTEDEWSQIILSHISGPEIALIERDEVREGELGKDELQEFIDEVEGYSPATAAAWLKKNLPSVKVIYAFQLLSGTEVNDGWTALHAVYYRTWEMAGGILQADLEGFSNREGDHILWQFSDRASGRWRMAVLGPEGKWIAFEMDLGNKAHREAFLEGRVPVGVVTSGKGNRK